MAASPYETMGSAAGFFDILFVYAARQRLQCLDGVDAELGQYSFDKVEVAKQQLEVTAPCLTEHRGYWLIIGSAIVSKLPSPTGRMAPLGLKIHAHEAKAA